jgi:multidrug resistance protein, MATE family
VRMARAESLGQAEARRAVIVSALLLSLVFGTLLAGLLISGAAPLTGAFFDSTTEGIAAAKLALVLLVVLGLIELVINPGQAAAGLLRGRKDTRAPMVYVLIGYWGVSAPLGLYLCEMQGLSITGIWIGLAMGTLVTTVLSLARLFRMRG